MQRGNMWRQACHFNPRSLAGATPVYYVYFQTISISIHAPLRERHRWLNCPGSVLLISIHAPLRERLRIYCNLLYQRAFQSTLPCGSDSVYTVICFTNVHFNPRSLAGATGDQRRQQPQINISIHAPLRERPRQKFWFNFPNYFNPRSLAGATGIMGFGKSKFNISIHAPLRERQLGRAVSTVSEYISIHAPLRERLTHLSYTSLEGTFQSTLPCGSDHAGYSFQDLNVISIHAPLRERPNSQL